jgi:hypothetical protein
VRNQAEVDEENRRQLRELKDKIAKGSSKEVGRKYTG